MKDKYTKRDLANLKAINQLLKEKVPKCKDFNPDCSNCKFYLLQGLLEWYKGIIEY